MLWIPSEKDLEKILKFADALQDPGKSKIVANIFDMIWHGKPTFLMFGPGGMEKTNLKEFLESFSHDKLTIQYLLSKKMETGKLKNRKHSSIYVFPGQDDLFEGQFDYHKAKITKARRPIVMFVLSYGHRSVSNGEYQYASDPQMTAQVLEEELAYVKTMLEKLRVAVSYKRWVIMTVVAKADLWWDDRNQVEEYYHTIYEKIIDDFRTKVGRDKSEHHILPVSLPRTPLLDKNNRIIKKPSQDYDDTMKRKHIAHLIKTINDILSA